MRESKNDVKGKRNGFIKPLKLLLAMLVLFATWTLPWTNAVLKVEAAPVQEGVFGFGLNDYGQLKLPLSTYSSPTLIPGLPQIKQVSAGGHHTLFLTEDGKVYAYGSNGYGQIGNGSGLISNLPKIKQVSAGALFSMALAEDGTVYAFGGNYAGQLGIGNYDGSSIPQAVAGLPKAKQIATGADHALVLTEDGEVYGFGSNNHGQLGLGYTYDQPTPQKNTSLPKIKQIAAGTYHSLALSEDGKIYAFGNNLSGQLGLGNKLNQAVPQEITGLPVIKQVSGGLAHSLVVSEDGEVYGFGRNDYGQLGLGNTTEQLLPVKNPFLSNIKTASVGENYSLVLTEAGKVYSFGVNSYGKLGLGNTSLQIQPQEITGLSDVKQISAGTNHALINSLKWTVRFESGGGTALDELYAASASTIHEPTPPLKTGYTFEGWYRDADRVIPFDFSTAIMSDLVLYAKWKINEYTLSFDSNGGSNVSSVSTEYRTTFTSPTSPVKADFAFGGWYSDPNLEVPFDFSTEAVTDLTVYAKWLDSRQPAVVLSTIAGNPTNQPFTVKAEFDEPVQEFDSNEIWIIGGTASNVETVSANVYSFEVTPILNGTIAVKLAEGAAKDLAGNGSAESNVLEHVFNSIAPTLSLNGEARMPVGIGTLFVDPGATAQDAQGVSLTEDITVTGNVYTGRADTYELKYSVSDSADNTSTVTRAVYVINPPTVSLNGEAMLTIKEGESFVDPGASASDTFHGDLSALLLVEGGVDSSKPGVYTLKYSVTNPIGQNAQAERQVTVTKKAEPPIIEPPVTQPSASVTPGEPFLSTQGKVFSSNGILTLESGQAGELRMDNDALLQVPTGATDRRMDIRINKLTTADNGLTTEVKSLSSVYQLTKNVPANFLSPVSLSLTFDPSKLANDERAAVFYQNADGSPWVRVEGGIIEQGRNAVGTASNSAVITVQTDHFTKFAVLAVNDTATVPSPSDSGSEGIVPAIAFTDISGHWAADVIREASGLGLVNGYADGTFRPSNAVTRAEFTAMLVRALAPVVAETTTSAVPIEDAGFADQASIRDWAQEPIAQAKELGWIKGDQSGNFRPNARITRAEMAVMLYRALTLKGGSSESVTAKFTDESLIPVWAREAVVALVSVGVLQGRADGKFDPTSDATRAETVRVIMASRQ